MTKLLSYKMAVHYRNSTHCYYDDKKKNEKIDFEIKLTSSPPMHPVIFTIENILSHMECDTIIKLIDSKLLRANKNRNIINKGPQFCRLYRKDLPLFDHVFGRIGDILDIDQKLLNIFCASYYKENSCMIEHYDQCNCTLIIYLNDLKHDQGGKTIFPKANLSLHPGKANALLFYTKKYNLKDIDPLSYHYGDKLLYGQKYIIMLQW